MGQKFGKLLVIQFGGCVVLPTRMRRTWTCVCDCGNTRTVQECQLLCGGIVSCSAGCTRTTHGESVHTGNTTEYRTWLALKNRCNNPSNEDYDNWGGRGIKVCEHWNKSFQNFLADMGRKPSPKHSIDRINVNGNYSCGKCSECIINGWPMNCRWATQTEQQNNIRTNVRLAHDGKTLTLAQWSRETGILSATIRRRLIHGGTPSECLRPVTRTKKS